MIRGLMKHATLWVGVTVLRCGSIGMPPVHGDDGASSEQDGGLPGLDERDAEVEDQNESRDASQGVDCPGPFLLDNSGTCVAWQTVGAWSLCESHTATRLQNGNVLVVGRCAANGVEIGSVIFDSTLDDWLFPTPGINNLPPRAHLGHTATLLLDGRVLIVGGVDEGGTATDNSLLFDRFGETFEILPPLNTARRAHAAVLLANGRVLVIGGQYILQSDADRGTAIASVEIFDPNTREWRDAAPLLTPRVGHVAQVLANGEVVVIGGLGDRGSSGVDHHTLTNTEIYNPESDTWRSEPGLPPVRMINHEAIRLEDGSVLVLDGNRAMRYNPEVAKWFEAGTIPGNYRAFPISALLKDGRVLSLGGTTPWTAAPADLPPFIYSLQTDQWTQTSSAPKNSVHSANHVAWYRGSGTATSLNDGRVLVVAAKALLFTTSERR